ncbi:hybrid sensor histidine kinase/response regulator [Sphingobium sp. 3R8]|uniref:histidine kinase n=1 Tax=Sphingomonas bisphenolicum TaxID=296544 RepID=A0ABN5WH59_9SPHN|nr:MULTISPECIES: hybrid sensor histidine kinase/response regulator [Sphingomonadaceae]MBZ9646642.1 hybrid sensor histidine kinase/response regulator [Sphingobium sp. 3R8]BBF71621.1 hybrid sensor histidine kinase/response regulator [Sphingomonas bisphenolicum]
MTSDTHPLYCLLVDDLEENLLALEALLQRDGLICLKARSGEEALELLLVHDVALALLDVQMPGMDGFELAEYMRGNERARHVPIIFVTAGSADRQRRFRGYEAGAVDFIQKPIEADILRSKAAIFFDLHDQRRQIIAQRDELATLAGALQAADRRKNEFLAILGHELRNPIAALAAGLHLLEKREGTEAARDIRGRMDRHVHHLSRLIEDILDIARIDQGKISLKIQRIVLQDVLAFAVETCQPTIEAAQHRLVIDIADDPIKLDADYARVVQIVSNLLSNAAKYTQPGGEVRLTVRTVDGWAEIEVADTGIGIAPDMQARIFDLFAQVKRSTGDAQDGLGIGLALVRQLVALHGGALSLKHSAPGEGSIFQVRLPTVEALVA